MEENREKTLAENLSDTRNLKKTTLVTLAWLLLLAVIITAGTYAWFTKKVVHETVVNETTRTVTQTEGGAEGNNSVSTGTASAVVGEDDVKLLLSKTSDFANATNETEIAQTNACTVLMPVSTPDLSTFYYSAGSVGQKAKAFTPCDESHQYYWQGRFYMKAEAVGHDGEKLKIYLDGSQAPFATNTGDGMFINAGRLGLTVDSANPVIFYLSDTENPEQDQINNTYLASSTDAMPEGNVLSSPSTYVADPSVPFAKYIMTYTDTDMILPEAPLMTIDMNTVYTIDVYVYLEGCDPDCSVAVEKSEADVFLAFYGMLSES